MKSVVTGASGFIGRHVVAALIQRGFDVIAYDSSTNRCTTEKGVQSICASVLDMEMLENAVAGSALVFHLSGILGTSELLDRPFEAIDVNVKGAAAVLEVARKCRVHKTFLPAKPNQWNNIYSVTAQAIEKLGGTYRDCYGMDVRILEILNVYGPGQALIPVRKVVPTFTMQALENIPIEVFGNGSQIADLIHVRDVAEYIVEFMLADQLAGETYAISSHSISVLDLAKRVRSVVGSNSKILNIPMRLGEKADSVVTPCRANLPIKLAITDLDIGLGETVDWYRKLPGGHLQQARRFYESGKE